MTFVPRKLYYKIGEVCEIVGVEAYVLRYWETEFPSLTPPKSKAGQRIYRPKDIELLLTIRQLLYEDGFTIAGARKQLMQGTGKIEKKASLKPPEPVPDKKPSKPPSRQIDAVRQELENILTLLDGE